MVTFKRESALRVGAHFSIYPIVVNTLPQLIEEMEAFSLIKAREYGLKPNDMVIITGGIPTGQVVALTSYESSVLIRQRRISCELCDCS